MANVREEDNNAATVGNEVLASEVVGTSIAWT